MRLDEAGKDFQKAVEADPHSAKAHLCLGVIHLFQYQNGVALQHDPLRVPDESGCLRPLTPAEVEAEAEKKRAQIVEQNATNAPSAEEHLMKALELKPQYEQAMEYLGALYFWWRDPAPITKDLRAIILRQQRWARRDDVLQIYTRIAEVNPRHRFANYVCGLIDYDNAFAIIRSTTHFRALLRMKRLVGLFAPRLARYWKITPRTFCAHSKSIRQPAPNAIWSDLT